MSIDLNTVSLPFDRLGTAATNKRVGERHTLTSVAWTEFNILIPKYAPFYSESIQYLTHLPSGKRLERGIDWIEGWYFQSASGEIGLDTHCCIYFYDNTLAGEVEIPSYQAMGGEWQINGQQLTEILAGALLNPLRYYWEQVAELPEIFNPLDHDQDIQDFTKLGDLLDVLREIAQAIGNDSPEFAEHIANRNNPHGTNAGHVGLGLVQNWPIAVLADLTVGALKTEAYMNPPMTYQMIQRVATPALNAHINNVSNPHGVNAPQTGAYYKAEVDALLESLARGLLHNVYAYRLEGKSVQDIIDLATGGSTGDFAAIRAEINAVKAAADAHAARTDNPHNTRADKTGAYFTTEVDALLATLAAGNLHNIYAYRLEGSSVNDIVSNAVVEANKDIETMRQTIMTAVNNLLANYTAKDSTKFAGLTQAEWENKIAAGSADVRVGWNITSPADILQSDTDAAIVLLAGLSEKDLVTGTTASKAGFNLRVFFGSHVSPATATQFVDINVARNTFSGAAIASGPLPAGVSFFLENWFEAGGAVKSASKRLYMRVPAGFPSINVLAMSMVGVTSPGATDAWPQTGWNGLGSPLATVAVPVTTYGTKEAADTIASNLGSLTTAVTTLGTNVQGIDTRLIAVENSNKVRYAQNRDIPANNKITIDLQTLVTDPADYAKYDYRGARVTVRLLDKVAGSDTLNSYILAEGTVMTALRGDRYLDLFNYDTVVSTVAVRIELPLL